MAERFTPPPTNIDGLPMTLASPRPSDGGSLIKGEFESHFVRPSVIESHLYQQPDYDTRPIDEITGLPYCFVPNPDLPPVTWPSPNTERTADWDHQYPKVETKFGANPALETASARLALMNLRIQWTNYDEHHWVWNNVEFIGPRQPATVKQLAATMLFGISGYVPPVGLDLGHIKAGKPQEKILSDEERRFLWESKQIRVACESPVIAYLKSYVLAQEVDHINGSQLDEFLHTFDLERRIYLGHSLAAKVIERAVEPFDGAYTKAYKAGLLSIRDTSGTVMQAPAHPRDLVKLKLSQGRRFGPVMDALAHRLKLQKEEQPILA